MPSATEAISIYRELADWHEQNGQPQQRDRYLVLAADAALAAGQGEEAERLRVRLLQLNPHHLLRPYASFAEALRNGDVNNYVTALRQSHPSEAAERLLASLRSGAPIEPVSSAQPPAELQVFRVRTDTDDAKPSPARPRQVPPPGGKNPAAAAPLARPIAPARLEPFPLPPKRARPFEPEESAGAGTPLVPTLLFGLLLVASVALAVYALAGPFFGR
jgi:hypothetical protein